MRIEEFVKKSKMKQEAFAEKRQPRAVAVEGDVAPVFNVVQFGDQAEKINGLIDARFHVLDKEKTADFCEKQKGGDDEV